MKGNVYGGGNQADVKTNTTVNIGGGQIDGNVYGGGKGSDYNYTCDKAMVGVNDDGAGIGKDPSLPANKDKGTKVTITAGTVGTLLDNGKLKEGTGNVYGGGEIGRVEWNTQVKIGVENASSGDQSPIILGSVFGAGAGNDTHGFAALVRGNCTVTIQGKAWVKENVYGGGEMATAGRYWVKNFTTPLEGEIMPDAPEDLDDGMPYATRGGGGVCTVIVQDYAQIGPATATDLAGHVFGAGKGVTPSTYSYEGSDMPERMSNSGVMVPMNNPTAYFQFLETLSLATKTHVTISETAQVKGNVYGGSESGFVQDDTDVKIQAGTIGASGSYGNVFGGGKGLAIFAEAGKVKGNTNVAISGGTMYGNVYGGGELGDVGTINKANINSYIWAGYDDEDTTNDTGKCTVSVTNAAAEVKGSVFGASKGSGITFECEKAMVYKTSVSISAGTVNGDVFGGGEIGRVENDTEVNIGSGTGTGDSATPNILRSVFGGGMGLDTHGYSALVHNNTTVTVEGDAHVGESVYGGGEIATVGRYWVKKNPAIPGAPPAPEDLPYDMPYQQRSGGRCTVIVQGHALIGSGDTGHVFGAGKGVNPQFTEGTSAKMTSGGEVKFSGSTAEADYLQFLETLALASNTDVTIDGNAHVQGSVYGGSESGFVQHNTQVKIGSSDTSANIIDDNVYGGGLGIEGNASAGRVSEHTTVTISGGTTHGSVFGGGALGIVKGNVVVNMSGGTVDKDVYGGGALANTNTDNEQKVTGLTVNESVVTGLYTKEDDIYTEITTEGEKAAAGTDYYKIVGTTVNLNGGTVKGDAYGGGLGRLPVTGENYTAEEATAYNTEHGLSSGDEGFVSEGDVKVAEVTAMPAIVKGDINVYLGDTATEAAAKATAFNTSYYGGDHTDVVKSGRVFGCNNLNGSPQGNVTVTVWKTVTGTLNGVANPKTEEDPENPGRPKKNVTSKYDVAALYGGGNLADYTTEGKKVTVVIKTCAVSIREVYGGGNAAAVPETDVLVEGAYEIETVFGGGNGKDPYTLDGGTTWNMNSGANVGFAVTTDVLANTLITGGTIHEAYGGSNKKGKIFGKIKISTGSGGTCSLDCSKVVAAGKDADLDTDAILVMGCVDGEKIDQVIGGADNANVNGNVWLTITSGEFGKVFGGNNLGGVIKGSIKLNIEETGCTPIKIDELYLGGNEAAYSIYGYYKEGDKWKPRTSDADAHKPVDKDDSEIEIADFTPYDDPVLNIISCTKIGMVFGGGLGTGAAMYANPTVNINMRPGAHANKIDRDGDNKPDGDPNALGEIGNVYGGGNKADVIGNPTVNIGTESKVMGLDLDEAGDPQYESDGITPKMKLKDVLGAYINGNVFGGGKGVASLTASSTTGEAFECAKAMVGVDHPEPTDLNGGTHVNIYNGTVTGNVYGGGEVGRVEKNTEVTIGSGLGVAPGGSTAPTSAPVIKGSVFGAGKGTNTHGYAALVRGNSTVTIEGNAKVEQNVYGGGQLATVGRYRLSGGMPTEPWGGENGGGTCTVTIGGYAEIGPDDMTMTKEGGPADYGHVFGAGMGTLPYDGYEDDEQPVHMDGKKVNGAWIDYYRTYETFENSHGIDADADYRKFIKTLALASYTNVTIKNNAFVKGSVYGGSENGFVQADTHVTIQDYCQIGNGYVQMKDDGTYLTSGMRGVNRRYTEAEWTAGHLDTTNDDAEFKTLVSANCPTSLPECASWPYGQAATANRYAPYDKFANKTENLDKYANGSSTEGGRYIGDDGHTFYGNVFGGGSGYYPYRPGKWFDEAGAVYGNTYLTITGGHILTNVYGGNEMTDVGKYADTDKLSLTSGGTCYVTMIGGTLGVPRTLDQIKNHPVTGYLFGAGKGDQRVFFNKSTNIGNAVIHISDDARIFGSVLGGGEDGHVMKNVTINIGGGKSTLSPAVADMFAAVTLSGKKTKTENGKVYEYPYIGTWGTSYFDGNVFGGGRGFGGDAYTAGNVAGKVTMNIDGGTMLGSVYGGGRLGSVGYGLFDAKTSGGADMPGYGEMRPDNNSEKYDGDFITSGVSDFKRGYVDITISGGTIGNDLEYVYVPVTTLPADLQTWKNAHHIPNTDIDLYETKTVKEGDNDVTQYIYRLSHTKGGNVFAGGMGRQKTLSDADISGINWEKLGCVKQTKLTITGGKIKSNVYGGGELGAVIPAHNTTEGGNTDISISGTAVIGSPITEKVNDEDVVRYTFGSVYGGGMGSEAKATTEDLIGGRVEGSTKISMTAGEVKASVYGGGELAVVKGGQAAKDIAGNDIKDSDNNTIMFGTDISISGTAKVGYDQDGFGGATMGNVYGGGKGSLSTAYAGLIKKNTLVKISGSAEIYHNIYGGGAYGSVGTFTFTTGVPTWSTANGTGKAEVIIEGGTIGVNGHENGMIFGSSRGDVATPAGNPAVDPNDKLAWVYDTHVTIGTSSAGPSIRGTVYGSGENGHVFNNTVVDIHKGTIGIAQSSDVANSDITVTKNGVETIYKGAAYPYRGNVYGGGCGTDTYKESGVEKYNPLAGIVLGNTNITMDGGTVVYNIYGAGAMGSVGTKDNTGAITSGGKTTIAISGGTVGVDGNNNGNVFGAARGDETTTQTNVALVKTTDVTISGDAIVWGNVYGGGEAGDVGTYTTVAADGGGHYKGDNVYPEGSGICNVTVEGGTIHRNVFGAGKGVANTFQCAKAMASSANVTITGGKVGTLDADGKLKENTGNVYGGGEIGRVEYDTKVKIGDDAGANKPEIYGSVFGAGAGVVTHGYSALVRNNTTVTIQAKSEIGKSVYGGGQIASVGKYGLDAKEMPSILKGGGVCAVTIKDNVKVGVKGGGNVFGAGQGVDIASVTGDHERMTLNNAGASVMEDLSADDDAYKTFLETLGLATAPTVNIEGSASVNGSVYGGGEVGITKGAVVVNIKGGTIEKDVYGGGALANTNTGNRTHTYAVATPPYATSETLYTRTGAGTDESPYKYEAVESIVEGTTYYKAVEVWADNNKQTALHTTSVNLTGGVIKGDAYGGGLGDADHPALVYGDVQVELNGTTVVTKDDQNNDVSTPTPVTGKGCQVSRVFGCNNVNGSPKGKVNVHVYATQRAGKPTVGASDKVAASKNDGEWDPNTFDVKAVYGGGNMAAYEPVNALLDYSVDANKDAVNAAYARVIIDGCDLTSIGQVYGGGNAASAPATYITINGDYEIGEVFGGGNGRDKITVNNSLQDNPGANVGFHAYPEGTTYDVRNAAPYIYGSGVALTEIFGGIVHAVYGGSNSKGNIRTESHVILDDQGCHFDVGEAYGGGKSADMDGAANLEIRCISQMGIIYGGAENADVLGDVTLNVTNGHYDQVFGGNNEGGRIGGAITVNIEETGCSPIIIGELYGGGNKAGYSKWGYKKVNGKWLPRESKTDNDGEEQYTTGVGENGYDDPQVNVKSFTSIGNIFGGGYGESAKMVADPHIYIDEVSGLWYDKDKSVFTEWTGDIDGDIVTIPAHTKGTAIGAIQNVFGGGNAAPVIGTPHVYIGTQEYVKIITGIVVGTTDVRGYYTLNNGSYTEVKGDNAVPAVANTTYYKKVVGVDIRGNVYGGGNNATVTGDTDVQIGRKIE